MAISCTLFLFIHTRDLNAKLDEMQGKLNIDMDNEIESGMYEHIISLYILTIKISLLVKFLILELRYFLEGC